MAAMPNFISRFFDSNARDIAKYQLIVTKINDLEPKYAKFTDAQLKEEADRLREQVQKEYKQKREASTVAWETPTDQKKREEDRRIYDPILDEVLPEAFALVREASKRTLRMR